MEIGNNKANFITSVKSVTLEDNKAIILGWNKTKAESPNYQITGALYRGTLYEAVLCKAVHDYSTGEILLDTQIGTGYFSKLKNERKQRLIKYQRHIRQLYPKPTLFNEIRDYFGFILDTL